MHSESHLRIDAFEALLQHARELHRHLPLRLITFSATFMLASHLPSPLVAENTTRVWRPSVPFHGDSEASAFHSLQSPDLRWTAVAFVENGIRWEASDFPLDVWWVGAPPEAMSRNDVESALKAATQTWSTVPCSRAELTFRGFAADQSSLPEKSIAVQLADPSRQTCFPDAGFLGWTVITCPDPTVAEQTIFLNSTSVDWVEMPDPKAWQDANRIILSSPSLQGAPQGPVDLRAVLTHELGHVLGLAHTDSDPLATMAGQYLPDGGQRTLSADDKWGICSLYPLESVDHLACADDAECPHEQSCRDYPLTSSQNIGICEERRTEVGQPCAIDAMTCRHACLLHTQDSTTGVCTQSCDDSQICPEDMQCGIFGDLRFCEPNGGRRDAHDDSNSQPGPVCSTLSLHELRSKSIPSPFVLLFLLGATLKSLGRCKSRAF